MDKQKRFTKVVEENEGLLYKITTLYTNSYQDRKDLYQEIVYQLWKSFDSFKEQSKLSTWIYRVALNTAIYILRKAKRKVETVPIDVEKRQFPDQIDKTEEDRVKMLYEQIQRLNLLERGIILLYLEGKSYDEIALIIGITTSNVGTRISRIKEKLKSTIAKNQ